jgi:hypothetical protein
MQKIQFRCSTCGEDGWLKGIPDEETVEDIKKHIDRIKPFECGAGNHVELSAAGDHWVLKPETLQPDEKPLTDEEWLARLQEKVGETWTTDELTAQFKVIGFTYGICSATQKSTEKTGYLAFSQSPSGKRYYHSFE